MVSGDAFRSNLRKGLANTDNESDNNVSIGYMTSPIYVIMHSRLQQVQTKLRLLFICFAIFSLLNLLIMQDKQKTILVSSDIKFIRLNQKPIGPTRQALPFLRCFWYRLINLISKDTNMVFSMPYGVLMRILKRFVLWFFVDR